MDIFTGTGNYTYFQHINQYTKLQSIEVHKNIETRRVL